MGIFIAWIFFAFVVGFIGSDRKVGFWGAFLWSLLLSPLIGLIITLASESNSAIRERKVTRDLIKTQNEMIHQQTEALKKIQDPNYLTEAELKQLEKDRMIFEYKEKYSKGEISLEEFTTIENNIRGENVISNDKKLSQSDILLIVVLVAIAILIFYWN